ncbi:unnamed protein product [Paramecium pentaurelia]|uniref:CCT domain-containing protein n=1 Tax=Paramecium pentaurelia TaxID=43138 RepID=A0A8S1SZP0_9CILI|nr:unnamed protein product [Paramecium pentaurelia]
MFQTIHNLLPSLYNYNEYIPAKIEIDRLTQLEARMKELKIIQTNNELYTKQIIRRQSIERYKQKKRFGNAQQIYQVRKIIAEKRLRINGQFLTQNESEKILLARYILGKKKVQIINNNVKIKISNEKRKENLIKFIDKLMPDQILQKIQNKQRIFKIK